MINKQDYPPDRYKQDCYPLHRRTRMKVSDKYWDRINDVRGQKLLLDDARSEDFTEMSLKTEIERLLHEIETLRLTGERDKFVVECLCKAMHHEKLTTGEASVLGTVFRVREGLPKSYFG